ncbi:hypothetical protein WA026_022633 [Henosepilachna vigintioctopunctata]|uniref:Ig-like domain-containing protein n=1 Tax=Henosepilachna vigintioctopunctata TaxID=420089 RepID=A0AAW1U4C8_9CUCU
MAAYSQIEICRPPPTVSWFVNDKISDGKLETIGNHVTVNRLEVSNLQRDHLNSTFKCQASNTKLMMPAEKTVRLELLLRPLSVAIINKPHQMISDRDYTISCAVDGSRPKATITWTRENRVFRRGKITEETNETSVVSSVAFAPVPEDDGTFLKCIGDNSKLIGVAQEDSFKLNVVCKYPKILYHDA